MKNLSKYLSYLPLILYFVLNVILICSGKKIRFLVFIFSLLLLAIIGYTFNKHKYKNYNLIFLIIFTLWYLIKGNYDTFRWFSSIIGIIIFSYYLILSYLKKKNG